MRPDLGLIGNGSRHRDVRFEMAAESHVGSVAVYSAQEHHQNDFCLSCFRLEVEMLQVEAASCGAWVWRSSHVALFQESVQVF